jgi:hypothetical protein
MSRLPLPPFPAETAAEAPSPLIRGCARLNHMTKLFLANNATQNDSDSNPRYAEQLETLWSRVDQLNDGAFRPFSQQPLVRALLWPLGSFGWTNLIESGMLPGL